MLFVPTSQITKTARELIYFTGMCNSHYGKSKLKSIKKVKSCPSETDNFPSETKPQEPLLVVLL